MSAAESAVTAAQAPTLRVLCYKPRPARQTVAMERVMCCEPLELEYLAAYLEEHDVTLLDGMVDRRDPARLALELGADAVLITSYITNVGDVCELARELKQLPDPPLVFVGGPHAEVCPEHFASPHLDGVYFANQLEAIAQTLQRVARGLAFDDVAGGAFWRAGELRRNPAPALDPNRLRRPKRLLFQENQDRYFYVHHQRCASIKTAFGCHESCSFCFCTQMYGGRYGPRPLDDVIDEIAEIDAESIFIVDDNFLSSERRCLDFAARVEQRELRKRYIAYGDAAFVANHPHVVEALAGVGLDALVVGFEFIDDDALVAVNKKSRLADNDRCVEVCRQHEVELNALFMVDPGWRPEAFARLADYVRTRELSFAGFSTLTDLPGVSGSPVPSTALTTRWGPHTRWWRYDLLRLHQRPTHMSAARYYLLLLYLYLVPSMSKKARATLLAQLGFDRAMGLSLRYLLSGIEFLGKLLIWR